MSDFPKVYEINPKYKKSLYEREVWSNETHIFETEIMWRQGTYLVTINDQEEEETFLKIAEEEGILELDDYEFEMLDTYDSCSEDYNVYDKQWNQLDPDEDTYAHELLEAYQEDWSDALYERDFDSDEMFTTIYNGFEYTLVEE